MKLRLENSIQVILYSVYNSMTMDVAGYWEMWPSAEVMCHKNALATARNTHRVNHSRGRYPNICDKSEDINELSLDILPDTLELSTNTAENSAEENATPENAIVETCHPRLTRAPIKRLTMHFSERL
ncbi:hypothetical protein EG68_10500 [Paragonimus skrjabini miyazakii]|uniref:Uncharacterized protein n=1 Tax=Paragonimus skrjabini miyazakii TaxID=59628 RepID=A0A8S9YKY7_9TREM|nr:hypothetical protein EG68_10500 [Paragonimus skrjabini miyazakii]